MDGQVTSRGRQLLEDSFAGLVTDKFDLPPPSYLKIASNASNAGGVKGGGGASSASGGGRSGGDGTQYGGAGSTVGAENATEGDGKLGPRQPHNRRGLK